MLKIDRELVGKYAAVLDDMPVAGFLMSTTGAITYLNVEWRRITGCKADSTAAEEFVRTVHSEDTGHWPRPKTDHRDAAMPWRHELRMRFADGSYRWIVARANPVYESVAFLGYLGTLIDIDDLRATARKLADAEERLRVLTEALPGATYTATPDGQISDIADGSMVFDAEPEARLGDGWTDGLHPEDRARARSRWDASVATGDMYEIENRVKMPDQSYRWLLSRAFPQRDEQGRLLRWVGIAIDIEDRVRLEEQLRQFVAEAGHQLRTPVTVIAGYADLLRRGAFDDVALRAKALDSLIAETKRMRGLIERLMTLARLDAGAEKGHEIVNVTAIVRQAVNSIAVIATAPISLVARRSFFVLGDPSDLYDAIANLIDNAVKYGEGSAVRVTVASQGDNVAVRVADGGPGISDAQRPRIFERFIRGIKNREIGGSGLGLAIATQSAERLGGKLELEDPRAGSTTFVLTMPELRGIDSSTTNA